MILGFTKVWKKLGTFEAETDYRYITLKMMSTTTCKIKWMTQVAAGNWSPACDIIILFKPWSSFHENRDVLVMHSLSQSYDVV